MHFRTPSLKLRATLEHAIGDLRGSEPLPAKHNETNGDKCRPANHEYMLGGHSSIFMSRQRVRSWGEPSFTIQAGARHAPLHPQAPKMVKIGPDRFEFESGKEGLYRRLSVREAARVQSFPDDHVFHYDRICDGYKMIGNAVPVTLAQVFADHIREDVQEAVAGLPITHKRSKLAERKRKYAGSRA
jgi:DNA (cytosine-5)-methyltransferase 1